MELKLPTSVAQAETTNPRKLLLFSHTKVGKTKAASMLNNNLIIDLEDGAIFYDALTVNVKKVARENNVSTLKVLKETAKKIAESDHKYDYITIDTTTALENAATSLATILYKKSAMGKNFSGKDVVSELPMGAGYTWLRLAFDELYNLFEGLASKAVIFLGHIKLSSIDKDGKEIMVKDLNLTGKIKLEVVRDMDAIGVLYRDSTDSNKLIADFTTNELNISAGTRSAHLKDKKILLLEFDAEKDTYTSHWDEIFI